MLMFGKFNYGKSGILNQTHTRLFTSINRKVNRILNFKIIKSKGIPIPFHFNKNKFLANFF